MGLKGEKKSKESLVNGARYLLISRLTFGRVRGHVVGTRGELEVV